MAAPETVHQTMTWMDHYGRMLEASGLDRISVLSDALECDTRKRTACLSLAQCLRQPSLLIDQVRKDYPDAKSPKDIRARLSVLQQDLALSVMSPLTLRLFLDGQAATPDPERIFLASRASPGSHNSPDSTNSPDTSASPRWYQVAGGAAVDEAAFVRALAEQSNEWYPVFRHSLGVSPGAYWSSVGLALGAPFSAVWDRAEPGAICELAQGWLNIFDNRASEFIDWIPAAFGGRVSAIPQRKGCCLKYQLPNESYCGTCGVHRKKRLEAIRHPGPNPVPGQWQPAR